MPEQRLNARRFHLSDGIFLVACAALMLSADRAVHEFWVWCDPVASFNPLETRRMALSLGLTGASLALLLATLLRPSDRNRLRTGAPGLLVHLAVAIVVAVRLLGWAAQASIFALFEGRPNFYPTRWGVEVMNYLGDDLRKDFVIAITAAWLTLALVRQWNPSPTWDDRLGRLIGLVWVGFYLGVQLMGLLP